MHIDWTRQPTPGEARSRRGAETRQRLVAAAAEFFAARGIDAVQPHEILAAAGAQIGHLGT